MAKMGRPKVEEPRRNKVLVRFTDAEFEQLKKCAENKNLTITETVRLGVDKMLKDTKK